MSRHVLGRLALLLLLLLTACGGEGPEPVSTPTPAESTPEAVTTEATPAPEPDTPGVVTVEKLPSPGGDRAAAERAGKPKRWLGISVANMADPIAGAPTDARAMLQRAFVGGPARRAGLQRGDVIVSAAGAPVKRYQDYLAEARKTEIGDTLRLELLRDGEPLDVTLEMIAKPSDMKMWRRRHFPGTPSFDWDVAALRAPAGVERISSAESGERPQVLYFWATWCGPCRTTSPMIQKLHEDLGDRIHLVAISSEELDALTPWLERDTKTYLVGRDDTGHPKLDFEVKSLPTAVLVVGGTIKVWDYGVAGVQRIADAAREEVAP